MSDPLVAVSPLTLLPADSGVDGWAISTRRIDGDLVISDASPLSKLLIRCAPAAAPEALVEVAAGRARWSAEAILASPVSGEWHAYAAPGERAALVGRWHEAVGDAMGLVVDLTHARAAVWLRGRALARLLGQLCALDVARLPPAAATRTAVAGVTTDLVLADTGDTPGCLLCCDRSYGAFLAACLLEEGSAMGIVSAGFELPWAAPGVPGEPS